MSWTSQQVLKQSRLWLSPWYPPDSTRVTVDGYDFYIVGTEATLMGYHGRSEGDRPMIDGALRAAADCDVDSIRITLLPNLRAESALTGLAPIEAVDVVATTDILAIDLDSFSRSAAYTSRHVSAVNVIEVGTYEQVAEFERTSALGWGYRPPSNDDIRAAYERRTPGSFLAYLDGIASGTGCFTVVGKVARFWGASVVAAMRGRGVYRALVAARLANAAERSASLALVHAEPTSSPILQSLDFRKFGERHTVRIRIGAQGRNLP